MNNKIKTVPEALTDLGTLFTERNALYGDNYKRFGQIMMKILGPIEIKDEFDYNRYMTFFNIMTKIIRLSSTNIFHEDSFDDLSVYSQMLKEINLLERDING